MTVAARVVLLLLLLLRQLLLLHLLLLHLGASEWMAASRAHHGLLLRHRVGRAQRLLLRRRLGGPEVCSISAFDSPVHAQGWRIASSHDSRLAGSNCSSFCAGLSMITRVINARRAGRSQVATLSGRAE